MSEPEALRMPLDQAGRADACLEARERWNMDAAWVLRYEATVRDLEAQLQRVTEERDWLAEENAAQAYKGNSVQHWWAKARAYGSIVHGCSPALKAAGYNVESGPSGSASSIAAAVVALVARAEAAEAKLAVAVEALQELHRGIAHFPQEWAISLTRRALAHIQGTGTDELRPHWDGCKRDGANCIICDGWNGIGCGGCSDRHPNHGQDTGTEGGD